MTGMGRRGGRIALGPIPAIRGSHSSQFEARGHVQRYQPALTRRGAFTMSNSLVLRACHRVASVSSGPSLSVAASRRRPFEH